MISPNIGERIFQLKGVEKETVYEHVLTGVREEKETFITYKMFPVEWVSNEVWNRLKVFDTEEGTDYAKKFPKDKIEEIIKNSLTKIGWKENIVSEENYRKTLQAFGVIKRKKTKTLRFELEAEELEKLDTSQIERASLGIGTFRRGASVFFDEDSLKLSEDEDVAVLKELIDDETLPRMAI